MNFTAKAVVTNNIDNLNDTATVTFAADYADERNKEWSRYTPWLKFDLNVKPEVAQNIQVGKTYTVTFEESE